MEQRPRAPRKTFTPEPDVLALLEGKGWGELSEYVNEAIRTYANPPYWFQVPPDSEGESLEELRGFLGESRHSIILLGLSLDRLIIGAGDLLAEKVMQGVNVTAIILSHAIQQQDAIYRVMSRRLCGNVFVDDIIRQVASTTEFFLNLRRIGEAHSTHVQLLHSLEIPFCGLVVRDHAAQGGCRMRVNLYSQMRTRGGVRMHPFIEIDPAQSMGRVAYNLFYDYCQNVIAGATEILDNDA
jgi:hypothetical protein